MININRRPLLIVVSAPSGAGKTTLCHMLLRRRTNLRYSVSCTTRAPREGEVDGVSYNFMHEPEFERRVAVGEFIEHARVHGSLYGTLRATVEDILGAGEDVIMDIDVQGAAQIRSSIEALPCDSPLARAFVDIFIAPPSIEELRNRLEGRAKDSTETIERRMMQAEKEMAQAGKYMYNVINDDLERAESVLNAILTAEHHRVAGAE